MNLRRNILFLLAAGIMAGTASARADHLTSVIGLVSLTNYQAALLIITDSPPDASFLVGTHKWVKDGQEFDDLYPNAKHLHIAIRQIDFTNGVVRVKENGVDMTYVPPTTNLAAAAAGKNILLNHGDFDDTLDLYASIKGKTVLVHPDVKPSPVTISAEAHNKAEATAIIEKALREKGVTILADGNRFEWLVPAGATNIVSPDALSSSQPSPEPTSTNAVNTLPEGSINFIGVELPQALDVYQALTGLKWIQEPPMSFTNTIAFHNQTPLTKAETLHAFDVLLAWQGLKVVNADEKSFKVVPVAAVGSSNEAR